MKNDEFIQEQFAEFISDKNILIADSNATTCEQIANIFMKLGANAAQIDFAYSLHGARERFQDSIYHVVVCDYDLEKNCGLDLLIEQKNRIPDSNQTLFILATKNNSQSALARAAEEDVDTFIIKPFSAQIFKFRVLHAAADKLFSGSYRRKLEEGKELMDQGDFMAAHSAFEMAKNLSEIPSLAYYYQAQCFLKENKDHDAEMELINALLFNRIHYRCLESLYQIHLKAKRFPEAYLIIKRLATYYPANTARLTEVLRLAVITDNILDIENYFQKFTQLNSDNEDLRRYVCAGLLTCGRHYLKHRYWDRAKNIFKKANLVSESNEKVIKETIASLIEFKCFDEALKYFENYPEDRKNTPDYLAIEFLINDQRKRSSTLKQGTKLLKMGNHDALIYETLIMRYRDENMNQLADEMLQAAIEHHPKLKDRFLEIRTRILKVAA